MCLMVEECYVPRSSVWLLSIIETFTSVYNLYIIHIIYNVLFTYSTCTCDYFGSVLCLILMFLILFQLFSRGQMVKHSNHKMIKTNQYM